jgi:hypothetical protein
VKRGLLRDAVLAGKAGDGARPATPTPANVEAPRSDKEKWVIETLARLTRTCPDLLRGQDRLAELGVDSLTRSSSSHPWRRDSA